MLIEGVAMTKTKRRNFIIFVLFLLAISVVASFVSGCAKEKTSLSPESKIVEVKRGELVKSVSSSGNLEMPHKARLSFEIGGKVDKVFVEFGDKVEKGEVLAQLETSSLERAVERARTNLEDAQTNLKNAWQDLSKAGPDVRSQERAQNRVKQAENQVKQAKIDLNEALDKLEDVKITAPFSGVITEVNVKEGDVVASGSPIAFLLVDPGKVEMNIDVDEVDIAEVKVGQKATITLDSLPGKEFSGKVVDISPVGKEEKGVVSYKAKVKIENPSEELKGGMSGVAEIITERKENVLLIPNRAVRFEKGKSIVKVLVNEKIKEREITIGEQSEEWTEVKKGLKEGDKVVIEPIRRGGGFFR